VTGRRGRQDSAFSADGGYAAPSDDVPVYDDNTASALDGYSADDAAASALGGYSADDAAAGSGDPALDMLQSSVPGVPGEDYPIYAEVPETGFSCDGQIDGGYYADPEAECQAFHICTADGRGGLAKYSFLCPNGTILNQNYLICDWWFNFDCSEAEALAEEVNGALAAEREAASGDAGGDQAGYGAESANSYSAPAPAPVDDFTDAPAAGGYDAPTEAAADFYDEPLESYGASTAAPAGYAAPQEERGARTIGRSGRRRPAGRRQNGRRPQQQRRGGRQQFRG